MPGPAAGSAWRKAIENQLAPESRAVSIKAASLMRSTSVSATRATGGMLTSERARIALLMPGPRAAEIAMASITAGNA